MSIEFWKPLLTWIELHPDWLGLFILFVSFAESLLIVGLIMPGVALMFGAGILIGTGYISYQLATLYACIGAIAGDALSYELGLVFSHKIEALSFFRKRPGLIRGGHAFFHRHGGKSILFGRFIGPVRPIIPGVAGSLNMPRRSFYAFNVISALLWAPFVLLPGYAFGTSLDHASSALGPFVLYFTLAIIGIWLTIFLFRFSSERLSVYMTKSQGVILLDDPLKYQAKLYVLLTFVTLFSIFVFSHLNVLSSIDNFFSSIRFITPLTEYFSATSINEDFILLFGFVVIVILMLHQYFFNYFKFRNWFSLIGGLAAVWVTDYGLRSNGLNSFLEPVIVLYSWLFYRLLYETRTKTFVEYLSGYIYFICLISLFVFFAVYNSPGLSVVIASSLLAMCGYFYERGWLPEIRVEPGNYPVLLISGVMIYSLVIAQVAPQGNDSGVVSNNVVADVIMSESSESVRGWDGEPVAKFSFESGLRSIDLHAYLLSQGWVRQALDLKTLFRLYVRFPQMYFHAGSLPQYMYISTNHQADKRLLSIWPDKSPALASEVTKWFALEQELPEDIHL